MRSETISIHGGFDHDPATKAVAPPIYQTVAYEFDSADHGAALFNLEVEGFRYSRISNPTDRHPGEARRAARRRRRARSLSPPARPPSPTPSSPSPITAAISSRRRTLYGTTHTLLAHTLRRNGVEARFARSERAEDIAPLIDEATRAVFCESIGNPAGNICDIEAIAKVAHERGVPLIVDNTVATPILLRPIAHGADIVVHSLTKFMGGHGVAMGGAIVDSGAFDWTAQAKRFPQFSEPDESYHGLVYCERFGAEAYLARARSVYQRTTGAVLAPMSAFLLLQGIETVALRMQRHVENGRAVADFLRADPRVAWVDYAGFADSPYHALAQKYLGGRASSLLTFGVEGGLDAAKAFYDALRLVKRLVNIGDARSLCCHPASTTHRQMTAEEQRRAGVRPETIRLSVGLEHIDDIVEDLDSALCAPFTARARARRRSRRSCRSPSSALPSPRQSPICANAGRGAARSPIAASGSKSASSTTCRTAPSRRRSASSRGSSKRRAANSTCGCACSTWKPLPRAREARRAMAEDYRAARALKAQPQDALIVTGAEPRAPDLRRRAVLERARLRPRLGRRARDLDAAFLSGGARRRSPPRRHRPPRAAGQMFRRLFGSSRRAPRPRRGLRR